MAATAVRTGRAVTARFAAPGGARRRESRSPVVLGLALGVAVLYAMFAEGAIGIPQESLLQIGVAAIALATLAVLLFGRGLRASAAPMALAGLAMLAGFAAWSGLSIAWSISPDQSWLELNRALAYGLVAALALVLGSSLPRAAARGAARAGGDGGPDRCGRTRPPEAARGRRGGPAGSGARGGVRAAARRSEDRWPVDLGAHRRRPAPGAGTGRRARARPPAGAAAVRGRRSAAERPGGRSRSPRGPGGGRGGAADRPRRPRPVRPRHRRPGRSPARRGHGREVRPPERSLAGSAHQLRQPLGVVAGGRGRLLRPPRGGARRGLVPAAAPGLPRQRHRGAPAPQRAAGVPGRDRACGRAARARLPGAAGRGRRAHRARTGAGPRPRLRRDPAGGGAGLAGALAGGLGLGHPRGDAGGGDCAGRALRPPARG